MRTLALVPTPELETVLSAPLISLMSDGNSLLFPSKSAVLGAGSVLLQLLAVQHELGEPLNLNGDLLHDLLDDSVVPCPTGGNEALNAMFASLPSTSTKSAVLVKQMLIFKRNHTIFDDELRPPAFRRDRPSHFPPKDAIPVAVNGALKHKGAAEVEDAKPEKQVESSQAERKGKGETSG
jgi:hypothetical protein